MKHLYTYIIESQKESQTEVNSFIKNSEKMYEWWVNNVGDYYDDSHGKESKNLVKCELLNDKMVKCDCAGFVGAVLCLCGYTDDPLAFSVKYGSFNLDKHINNPETGQEIPEHLKIQYMKDLTGEWHVYKLSDINKRTECKPGDIVYSSGHVAIVGKNDKLLQCSEKGQDDRHFRAYWRLGKFNKK